MDYQSFSNNSHHYGQWKYFLEAFVCGTNKQASSIWWLVLIIPKWMSLWFLNLNPSMPRGNSLIHLHETKLSCVQEQLLKIWNALGKSVYFCQEWCSPGYFSKLKKTLQATRSGGSFISHTICKDMQTINALLPQSYPPASYMV